MIETKRFLVKGKVQGVGFRYFARETALKFSISGWIRNREDGFVEGEASAESADLIKFFDELSRGNYLSEVSSVEISDVERKDFSCFEIRF